MRLKNPDVPRETLSGVSRFFGISECRYFVISIFQYTVIPYHGIPKNQKPENEPLPNKKTTRTTPAG